MEIHARYYNTTATTDNQAEITSSRSDEMFLLIKANRTKGLLNLFRSTPPDQLYSLVNGRNDKYDRLLPVNFAIKSSANHLILIMLLRLGAQYDNSTESPLLVAVRCGLMNLVKILMITGADVNALDRDGYSILHWACFRRNTLMARLILKLPDFNFHNHDRNAKRISPLGIAVDFKCFELVRELLKCPKVDPNLIDSRSHRYIYDLAATSSQLHTCIELESAFIRNNRQKYTSKRSIQQNFHDLHEYSVEMVIQHQLRDQIFKFRDDPRGPFEVVNDHNLKLPLLPHPDSWEILKEEGAIDSKEGWTYGQLTDEVDEPLIINYSESWQGFMKTATTTTTTKRRMEIKCSYLFIYPGRNLMFVNPTPEVFDELFHAVEVDSVSLIVSIFSQFDSRNHAEFRFNLLTQRHPSRKLTVLQWAIKNYPKTSVKTVGKLLEMGAGTELLSLEDENDEAKTISDDMKQENMTPLWMAIERRNISCELIRLLLDFKAAIYIKLNIKIDDKSSSNSSTCSSTSNNCLDYGNKGYSLLHLAVWKDVEIETFELLASAGGPLLLNDQSNPLKETPLMLAVRQNNSKMVKLLLEHRVRVDLVNSEGLSAYEMAAKEQLVEICFHFEEQLVGKSLDYHLEILHRSGKNPSYLSRKGNLKVPVIRDLNESDELLPLDGYWEWQTGDWTTWHEGYVYRLRKRIRIGADQEYLKEAIDMAAEGKFQSALTVLLQGLQHEPDPRKKTLAAGYFQRLLQRTEKSTPVLGILDSLSRTDLIIVGDDSEMSSNFMSGAVVNNTAVNSEDSLLYCPVCSHRLSVNERESHLKTCLSNPRHPIIGDRYTALSKSNEKGDEECPICYEELTNKSGVVLMNCLCRFHQKCIDRWLSKGKQCPFHNNNI